MVKIRDLEDDLVSEESAASTDEDTTEEEDGGLRANMMERPPDPPYPHDPLLFSDASSVLQPAAPEVGAGLSSVPQSVRRSALGLGIRSQLRVAPTRYFWDVIARYGHCVELQTSLRGHGPVRPPGSDCVNMWAVRLQQLAGQPNRHGNLEFAPNITTPYKHDNSPNTSESSDSDPGKSDTVDLPIETNSADNRDTEHAPDVSNTATVAAHAEEATDRDDGKPDSDESIEEKSNGVGDKEQTAVLAPTTTARPTSSPDHSDFELSDVSDAYTSPDYYDTFQAELKDERNTGNESTTTSLTDRPWTMVRETCQEDLDPEIKDSTYGKETSKCSEEGDAACLPAHSTVKNCWEEWVNDEELFNLSGDVDVPSTSAGVRLPNPVSQGARERRRVKLETHYRGRERERTAKPIERFIFVPTEKIGRILGKGGRRIRDIERTTGANIKIEHRRSTNPVTQITMTGTDEQISKADEEICVIIRNFKPPNEGEPTTVSVSSREEMDLKRMLNGIKNQVLDAEKRCREP